MLASKTEAALAIQRLKAEYENYQKLLEKVGEHDRIEQLINRSLFVKPCVKQLVMAFTESGWKLTEERLSG